MSNLSNDQLISNSQQNSESTETKDQETSPSSVKHQLENEWTFHFQQFAKGEIIDWDNVEKTIKEVYSFATVEDYWCLINNLKSPNHVPFKTSYYMFKKGIFPKWEEESLRNGGDWQFTMDNKDPKINDYWVNSTMALIGEIMDDEEQVGGIVFNSRAKGHRLSLWIKCYEKEKTERIGRKFKEALGTSSTIEFKLFTDQLGGNSGINYKL